MAKQADHGVLVLNCPHCGGVLTLAVYDSLCGRVTQVHPLLLPGDRVYCQHCGQGVLVGCYPEGWQELISGPVGRLYA